MWATWSQATPREQSWGYGSSLGKWSHAKVWGTLMLALGAVGAPSAPGTCCRTFTWTCGRGTGACPHPRNLLVLQPPVPPSVAVGPLQLPTRARSAEFPVSCRLGYRGLRGTWTCGRR
jgi:hypothetical protein